MRPSGTRVSLRGLSVVDDRVIWASGQRGTVLRTEDGGTTWALVSIPGADSFDIRSIHATNGRVAHAAATAGRIWRTTDGGRTWSLRYVAADTAVFIDAIAFFDERRGIALADPIRERFLILQTQDGGETWTELPANQRPAATPGEVAFAASGTSLVVRASGTAWLGTGGTVAQVLRRDSFNGGWIPVATPLLAGQASGGVFSLAFADSLTGVAVGGDYQRPDSVRGNGAFTTDGGRTWPPPDLPPRGYRSGVSVLRRSGSVLAIAVGTTGSDVSFDGGRTWVPHDTIGFNAVQFAPGGMVFAIGGAGRVARFDATRLVPRQP